jgi:hypothetical protein
VDTWRTCPFLEETRLQEWRKQSNSLAVSKYKSWVPRRSLPRPSLEPRVSTRSLKAQTTGAGDLIARTGLRRGTARARCEGGISEANPTGETTRTRAPDLQLRRRADPLRRAGGVAPEIDSQVLCSQRGWQVACPLESFG